ncbi:expressed unknown protein [Seminavis robusta]|uniref:Uncharacterized protein n=1 Tax=Seminavis robusta TaxID=568900 RepID=A0A9N8D9J3_9STRA|nr:expressed unknown protein [Seminavis robusta]CAB9497706.1 expressed unknown protein [Seminavis robusta]|eukprot:Sro24_g016490.1 n/a (274) ;mRNA; r:112373-113194
MDLAWGLTNVSGHIAMQDQGKISPGTLKKPKKKTKGRRNKERKPKSSGRVSKSKEQYQQVVDEVVASPKSKRQPRNSVGSWAGLDLNAYHFTQAIGGRDQDEAAEEEVPKGNLPRKSSWGKLELALASGDEESVVRPSTRRKGTLDSSSHHSKSSWAGLDIFGEMDLAGYRLGDSDDEEEEETEHDFEFDVQQAKQTDVDHGTLDTVDDTRSFASEADADNGESFGNGSSKNRHWLDFDVNDLSDSDSESDSEDEFADDDESSSEEDDGYDSE